MAAIGIDTHKATLAACAVDERGAAVTIRPDIAPWTLPGFAAAPMGC